MRIAYLGAFTPSWNTEALIARALRRMGHDVLEIEELGSTVESVTVAALGHTPELFLFAKGRVGGQWDPSCRRLAPVVEAVRAAGAKVACWVFDLLAADFAYDRWVWAQRVATLVDVFAMTDGSTAPHFTHNALYLPQGIPDDVDESCPWAVPIVGDCLFLGLPYRDRQEFVRAFARRFGPRFRVENNTRGRALTRLVRSYRFCVAPAYPSRAWYESNRRFVIAGHGGLFASPSIEGTEQDGWLPGINYWPLSADPAEAAESLVGLPQEKLAAVRRAGFEHGRAKCTYETRLEKLLAALGLQGFDDGTLPTRSNS